PWQGREFAWQLWQSAAALQHSAALQNLSLPFSRGGPGRGRLRAAKAQQSRINMLAVDILPNARTEVGPVGCPFGQPSLREWVGELRWRICNAPWFYRNRPNALILLVLCSGWKGGSLEK